jgi:hypothetical protein
MAAKLTRLTQAIQVHLVAESCTICSSRSGRPVRKLSDVPSYFEVLCWLKLSPKPFVLGCEISDFKGR